MMKKKFDLKQTITDGIIEAIEEGTPPWRKGWSEAGAMALPLRSTGQPYRGINVLQLWMSTMVNGYGSPFWMTYKQAIELGGHVRKGEKSSMVVKYGTFEKEGDDGDSKSRGYLRYYLVFNVDQIDGLPDRFHPPAPEPVKKTNAQIILDQERWFNMIPVEVDHHDGGAFYNPDTGKITMPWVDNFDSANGYYHTRAHETAHWQQDKMGLLKDAGRSQLSKYSYNELTAELTACFISAHREIPYDLPNSAAYLEAWLKGLRADKTMIFKAANDAQVILDKLLTWTEGMASDAA